jgi:hypothetical protein
VSDFTHYEDWMASVGHPAHHILLGPDWWGCLCGEFRTSAASADGVDVDAKRHAAQVCIMPVTVGWVYADIDDAGPTMADVHQYLWEHEAFA